MVLSSLYFGMLFINWGDILDDGDAQNTWNAAKFSAGVKIVALEFSFALFSLSICLKLCCKDRIL